MVIYGEISLHTLSPEDKSLTDLDKFLFQPKKFEDMISTSKIVVDTNVLLAAYQYRNITFKELISTLDKLSRENRLVIPSHVMKEFLRTDQGGLLK